MKGIGVFASRQEAEAAEKAVAAALRTCCITAVAAPQPIGRSPARVGVTPAEEQRTLAAMNRHPAALAVVESNPRSGSTAGKVLDGLHPLIERHLASRFVRVATSSFQASTGALFDVWVNRGLADGTAAPMWCRSN